MRQRLERGWRSRLGAVAALAVVLGWGHDAAWAQEGNAEAGRTKAATCAACHGIDGRSLAGEWPHLAGQHADYMVHQLEAFKAGARTEVTMRPFALALSEQDMLDLAAYFSEQPPPQGAADPELAGLGERIYRGGIPERGVAACIACHGPNGKGNPLARYPRVSGQQAPYVVNTLLAYASGERRSDASVNQMMRNIAALLREDEMRALATYMQGLR